MATTAKHKSLYIRRIPPEVKTGFKTWCAAHNTNMTDVIVELMMRTIDGKPITFVNGRKGRS